VWKTCARCTDKFAFERERHDATENDDDALLSS
jgi:hypothetical protein